MSEINPAVVLADIQKSFDIIKGKMDADSAEVVTLKTAFENLERSFLEMKDTQRQIEAAKGPVGFTDKDTAKSFINFSKDILHGRTEFIKQMNVGTDADGGYLVPEEFSPTLLRMIEIYGVARRESTVIPMNRMELSFPRLLSGTPVYWVGEGQPITQTKPSFGTLKMTAKKLASIVPVTSELLEDSTIAIANLIVTLFAEAIAQEEDRICFVGDVIGNGDPFNGVLHDPDVTSIYMPATKVAFGDVTADDLSNMIAALPTSAHKNAVFRMHPTVFNLIRTLKSSLTGEYIYAQPGLAQPGMIWGYPYQLIDSMPMMTNSGANKPFIVLGNLKHMFLGDRRQMGIVQSNQVGFINDLIHIRVIERISIAVGLPKGFTVLRTAAA